MELRPYQRECLDAIRAKLAEHDSTLAVLATGTGKTVIFSHLANEWPGRVLVVAHREELITQAAEKLHAITGQQPAIEMGQQRVSDQESGWLGGAKCVVTSVQTMSRENRYSRFHPEHFALMVVDEAHHAVAGTYRRVMEYFRCKQLGVTATPKRADQLAMQQRFQSVAFDYGIEPASHDGWLVPVRQQFVTVEGLDFSKVREVCKDLNEGELEAILTEEKHLHAVARPTIELSGDMPALVFCVTVEHARLMSEVLNRYKPHSAKYLCGETDRQERRQWVDRYKEGGVQYLCNCALFLEGFDAPNTTVIVMARPTKSLALYTQVLGRGTRAMPGVVDGLDTSEARRAAIAASAKPWMLALDFVGNSGRHKIINALDVLGGKWGEPVRAYAKKNLEDEERSAPVDEAMERAATEMDFEEECNRERERIKATRAKYRASDVSPFVGGSSLPDDQATIEMATPGQVWWLANHGVPREVCRKWTRARAGAVIGQIKRGRASG